MSTKMTKLVLAMGAMVMAGGAMADQSASATAATEAVVVKPIVISKSTDLLFGRLTSTVGTVEIAASNGARSGTAAVLVAANGAAQAPGRASFGVSGEPGLTYSLVGPTAGDKISLSGSVSGELEVTLTGVYVLSQTSVATTGTLDATLGTDTLGVGGSITTAANTPSGVYSNAAGISITVAYN